MNYQEHYDRLISRARNRKLDCYTESHHIIPRCMSGTDVEDNLVDLTAREHFIAHLLLMKIYPKSYGLIKAVHMMCTASGNQERSMNRMYGWLKEKFSSEMSRSQTGKKNSQYGKMWIYSLELKENKKIPKGDTIPDGWFKGRKISFEEKLSVKSEVCMYRLLKNNSNLWCISSDKSIAFRINVNMAFDYIVEGYIITKKIEKCLVKNVFHIGVKHSELTKKKMKGHTRNTGMSNPMYGTKYMFNENLNICKRIKSINVEEYLLDGWSLGYKKF